MDVVKVNPFTNVAASSLATTQFIPDRNLALYGIVLVLGGTFTVDAHQDDAMQRLVNRIGTQVFIATIAAVAAAFAVQFFNRRNTVPAKAVT